MTDESVPKQTPRVKSLADRFYKLLALLILISSFGVAWLMMDYQGFTSTTLHLPDAGEEFTIAPGSSVHGIASELARRGIIEKPYLFVLMAYLSGRPHDIKAGEYALQPGLHPPELLNLFASGKVMQHAFTIVEGWTFRDLRAALALDTVLLQKLAGLNDAEIMTRLENPGVAPEGWFLADTYHYPRGTTDLEFLRRAQQAMRKYLDQEWAQRAADLPYTDAYQALIMASIIEKETAATEERPRIAGVFVRRLKMGMPLQTDPTIIYGLGSNFDGDIKRNDLTADNPYNTYLRTGLTPTPIALPGKAALHAALHPAAGNELYFVSRGDGTHQFSATLDEHNKAVSKYQLQGRAPAAQKTGKGKGNAR